MEYSRSMNLLLYYEIIKRQHTEDIGADARVDGIVFDQAARQVLVTGSLDQEQLENLSSIGLKNEISMYSSTNSNRSGKCLL